MSYIKNSIIDNYNCSHFGDVDTCLECQYSLHTAHIKEEYRPSLQTWYNKTTKKRRNK